MRPLPDQFRIQSAAGSVATPTCGGCCCCCSCAATVLSYSVVETMNVTRLARSNQVDEGKRWTLAIAAACFPFIALVLGYLLLVALNPGGLPVGLTALLGFPVAALWAGVVAGLRRGAGQSWRKAWTAAAVVSVSFGVLMGVEVYVALWFFMRGMGWYPVFALTIPVLAAVIAGTQGRRSSPS